MVQPFPSGWTSHKKTIIMKKKLMMVALLLGTLSLGACVDDNETASVSAVREATAKQLKSVAAMNRAEAEATRTLAAAEVALMQAKAAAEKANAEYNQAMAEQKLKEAELQEVKNAGQSIENERKKAELEKQLANLEATKQQAQYDLADIAAQMEKAELDAKAAILTAQKDLKEAQQDLLDYEEDLANAKTLAERNEILAKRDALESLADAYVTAVNNLTSAKQDLYNAKSSLVRLENGLKTIQMPKEENIVNWKNQIAQKQLEIESYKKYANYTEDIDALKAKQMELDEKKKLLYDDYQAALLAYNQMAVDNTESQQLVDSLKYKDKFSTFARTAYTSHWSSGSTVWYRGYYYDGDARVTTDNLVAEIVYNNGTPLLRDDYAQTYKVYTYEGGGYSIAIVDSLYIPSFPDMPDFRGDVEIRMEKREAELKEDIKTNEEKLALAQRKYNGTPTKGDFGINGDDGKPSTEPCKNLVDSTAYLKPLYEAETDADKKDSLRTLYNDILDEEVSAKREIEWRTENLEALPIKLARFQEQWDMLKNYATYQQKLQATIDTFNTMREKEYAEKIAAWFNYRDKWYAYSAVNDEITAINVILNGYYNSVDGEWVDIKGADGIATSIKNLEDDIAQLQAWIEDYSEIQTQEEAIEWQKKIVAAYEEIEKAREVIVAKTKAELDAAVAENEGTEE